MFQPNVVIEPRMADGHAVSLFKLVGPDVQPMAAIIVWQNTMQFMALEKNGKLKEVIEQLKQSEAAEAEQARHFGRAG